MIQDMLHILEIHINKIVRPSPICAYQNIITSDITLRFQIQYKLGIFSSICSIMTVSTENYFDPSLSSKNDVNRRMLAEI